MKKIKSRSQYLRQQRRKQKRALQSSIRKKNRSKLRQRLYDKRIEAFRSQFKAETVRAPSNFSLVNNPEECLSFLAILKQLVFDGYSVVIDLSEIQNVTNDALIAFLTIVNDKKVSKSVRTFIKVPNNARLAVRLKESGITKQYNSREALIAPKFGRIRQKGSYRADMQAANELIQFATRQIFGQKRRLFDVQRILAECIDNTTFHASPDEQLAEMWWATVFCDDQKKIAYFSILDNGVGIIDSLKMNWVREIKFLPLYRDNAALMKSIFEGEVLSRTGEANRGKGLPSIYKARGRKEFVRLIVISNNVYVDFDKVEYRLLKTPFSGTFFYWEVRNTDEPSA